ncbi:hypothetical protein [Aequorivita marina]|uniref:hypothetical protein n=1 Tax=Aequorivita marina TaxID=3073654 RepID=UPI002875AD45|nr:hypothetical protein [Aequorivita sp. S2608]MDS1298567.1 hypothetical protein [Aequorivita sp. S2608]
MLKRIKNLIKTGSDFAFETTLSTKSNKNIVVEAQNIIIRRYENGLNNFFSIFKPLVDFWTFIDASDGAYIFIAEDGGSFETITGLEILK